MEEVGMEKASTTNPLRKATTTKVASANRNQSRRIFVPEETIFIQSSGRRQSLLVSITFG